MWFGIVGTFGIRGSEMEELILARLGTIWLWYGAGAGACAGGMGK